MVAPSRKRNGRESEARSLLIVDRLPLVAEAIGRLLESQGFRVLGAASTVESAAELLETSPPHIVIIDATLDLADATRLSRLALGATSPVKVVFLDDHVHERRLSTALCVQASGYWTKQMGVAATVECLRRIALGETVLCEEAAALLARARDRNSRSQAASRSLAQLTRREREIVPYLARGLSVRETAAIFGRSVSTVDNHKTRLMKKLGLHRIAELTRLAIREGLIEH